MIGHTIVAKECRNFFVYCVVYFLSLFALQVHLCHLSLSLSLPLSVRYRKAGTTISHYFPEHLAHTSKYFLFPSKLLQLKIWSKWKERKGSLGSDCGVKLEDISLYNTGCVWFIWSLLHTITRTNRKWCGRESRKRRTNYMCWLSNITIFIPFLHFIRSHVRKCLVQDDTSTQRVHKLCLQLYCRVVRVMYVGRLMYCRLGRWSRGVSVWRLSGSAPSNPVRR